MDIRHQRKRLKQGNKPICGIYAFLNGFYDGNSSKLCKWECLADDLWKAAIDQNIPNNISVLNKSNVDQYSFLGEFFDSGNLEKFLQNINIQNRLSELISPQINKICISDIEKIDWDKFSCNQEKTFYLVPINSWKKYKDDRDNYNMHWICLKETNGKIEILNSASDKSGGTQSHKTYCR